MTHTFKVGDKGKTRGGDGYEVTAVGRKAVLVEICNCEVSRRLDGFYAGPDVPDCQDLLPPTKRIRGWVNIYSTLHGSPFICTAGDYFHKDRRSADDAALSLRIACIYINIEEGEGL